jgi:hypothetical protein
LSHRPEDSRTSAASRLDAEKLADELEVDQSQRGYPRSSADVTEQERIGACSTLHDIAERDNFFEVDSVGPESHRGDSSFIARITESLFE